MNKYKNLLVNTIIFGIGTFSSKILVFLLVPVYTKVLSNSEYGVVDLIVQTANLLIPVVTAGVASSIIRFGLDKNIRKSDVFTIGVRTFLVGFVLFLLCMPLIQMIKPMQGYTFMMYIYIFTSGMRQLCSQFVRARQKTKLYALDGFLSTVTLLTFNLVFLLGLKWGITGYILAIILSDFLSILFLFITGKLHRFLTFGKTKRGLAKEMLRYCIPLIPTTVFWWITTVSDRYFITYMMGEGANGLYAVAQKVPNIVVLVFSIFMEAWQLSAISEEDRRSRERFFSKVFGMCQAVVFMMASGVILFSKVITSLLVSNDSFYPSWQYIPFLVLATSFSCLVSFLGSVYMVEKRSGITLFTTMIGAVVNLIFNAILIPYFGMYGAAFATFIGYIVVFLIRTINIKQFIRIRWHTSKLIFNVGIILLQSFLMVSEVPLWILWESLLCLMMLIVNGKAVLDTVLNLLRKRKGADR